MGKEKGKHKNNPFIRFLRFCIKFILYGFILSVLYIVIGKWLNPPITITQLVSVFEGNGLHRDYKAYKSFNNNIKLAVLAGEDQLFTDHNGFDFKSIQKAMKHNKTSKSLRGASTISQQTAKNVFLWQHGGYFRKGLEVYFTFMIEKIWGKKRILEVYLNVAETGKGMFGVEVAARKYFGKTANNLSRKEAAMIAACLPNPAVYTVKPVSKRVAYRSNWIVRQMNALDDDPDVRDLVR